MGYSGSSLHSLGGASISWKHTADDRIEEFDRFLEGEIKKFAQEKIREFFTEEEQADIMVCSVDFNC